MFEARRARSYAIGLAGLTLAGAGFVMYFGGEPLAQKIHVTALLITGVFALGYVRFARGLGAPNVDNRSRGSALRDYVQP